MFSKLYDSIVMMLGTVPKNKGERISDLLKYLIVSNLSAALPEITELSLLLLTFSVTSASVVQSFSVLNRVHTYLHGKQTQ
jgi:hypothetical protein